MTLIRNHPQVTHLKRTLLLAAISAVAALISGCSTTMFQPPPAPVAVSPTPSTPQISLITLPPLAYTEARMDFMEVVIPVESDLWQRVRRGFVMNAIDSPLVQSQELWYANRPDYIKRFVERGSRYMYHIVEEVERRGLPTEIVLLPIIESAFNPQAYSRAHASGMWQFIPSTGKNFGLAQDWLTDNRRDVMLSTNAALDYLTKLYGMFNSWELAFAAYNCGEGCVGRAIAKNQRLGLPTDFVNLKLPNETRAYVPKLLAVKNIVMSPASYGITLPVVDNRPYFTQVKAPTKIDVKLAARLAEMSEDDFAKLNPSFNKPVAATGTGFFLVPTENAEIFRTNLELYRSLNGPMVSWTTVTAQRGQSVDAVARKHGMTASYLRATNGPFKERKGKFTQPITFMAPNAKDAQAISAAFDKKIVLKREQQIVNVATTIGDDGPVIKPNLARENLRLATTDAPIAPIVAATLNQSIKTADTANEAIDTINTVSYVVKSGDTLFSIAKRSGMSLDALKAANKLTSNNVNVGQTLNVRGSDSLKASETGALIAVSSNAEPATIEPAAVSPTSTNKAKRATPARFHTVRAGDTLFSIAKRFDVTIANLQKWNQLSAKAVLKTGARLKVSGYTSY
jgi:membrane-bound lytic murein transglycosylase D